MSSFQTLFNLLKLWSLQTPEGYVSDNASALSSSLANARGIREGQNLGPSVPFSNNLQFSEPPTLASGRRIHEG